MFFLSEQNITSPPHSYELRLKNIGNFWYDPLAIQKHICIHSFLTIFIHIHQPQAHELHHYQPKEVVVNSIWLI